MDFYMRKTSYFKDRTTLFSPGLVYYTFMKARVNSISVQVISGSKPKCVISVCARNWLN